jgi:hypothetical protein
MTNRTFAQGVAAEPLVSITIVFAWLGLGRAFVGRSHVQELAALLQLLLIIVAGQSIPPHNFAHNTVVCTGTHDNATTRQWYEELPDYQRRNLCSYLKRAPGQSAEAAPALLRLAWSSPAAPAIAPLQDLLNLGSEARMNVPGRADGNWRWRVRGRHAIFSGFSMAAGFHGEFQALGQSCNIRQGASGPWTGERSNLETEGRLAW